MAFNLAIERQRAAFDKKIKQEVCVGARNSNSWRRIDSTGVYVSKDRDPLLSPVINPEPRSRSPSGAPSTSLVVKESRRTSMRSTSPRRLSRIETITLWEKGAGRRLGRRSSKSSRIDMYYKSLPLEATRTIGRRRDGGKFRSKPRDVPTVDYANATKTTLTCDPEEKERHRGKDSKHQKGVQGDCCDGLTIGSGSLANGASEDVNAASPPNPVHTISVDIMDILNSRA